MLLLGWLEGRREGYVCTYISQYSSVFIDIIKNFSVLCLSLVGVLLCGWLCVVVIAGAAAAAAAAAEVLTSAVLLLLLFVVRHCCWLLFKYFIIHCFSFPFFSSFSFFLSFSLSPLFPPASLLV